MSEVPLISIEKQAEMLQCSDILKILQKDSRTAKAAPLSF